MWMLPRRKFSLIIINLKRDSWIETPTPSVLMTVASINTARLNLWDDKSNIGTEVQTSQFMGTNPILLAYNSILQIKFLSWAKFLYSIRIVQQPFDEYHMYVCSNIRSISIHSHIMRPLDETKNNEAYWIRQTIHFYSSNVFEKQKRSLVS